MDFVERAVNIWHICIFISACFFFCFILFCFSSMNSAAGGLAYFTSCLAVVCCTCTCKPLLSRRVPALSLHRPVVRSFCGVELQTLGRKSVDFQQQQRWRFGNSGQTHNIVACARLPSLTVGLRQICVSRQSDFMLWNLNIESWKKTFW